MYLGSGTSTLAAGWMAAYIDYTCMNLRGWHQGMASHADAVEQRTMTCGAWIEQVIMWTGRLI
jgi:hypothetical protein